jgi:hypothetical protein
MIPPFVMVAISPCGTLSASRHGVKAPEVLAQHVEGGSIERGRLVACGALCAVELPQFLQFGLCGAEFVL